LHTSARAQAARTPRARPSRNSSRTDEIDRSATLQSFSGPSSTGKASAIKKQSCFFIILILDNFPCFVLLTVFSIRGAPCAVCRTRRTRLPCGCFPPPSRGGFHFCAPVFNKFACCSEIRAEKQGRDGKDRPVLAFPAQTMSNSSRSKRIAGLAARAAVCCLPCPRAD